jgi:hypothetical protein
MTGKDWDFTARSLDAARDKYRQKFSGKYNERQREARRKKSLAAKDSLERGLIERLQCVDSWKDFSGMGALAAAGSAQSLMCEEQGVVD